MAGRIRKAREQFDESLDDDLNTAEALAAIFEFVRDANTAIDAGSFGRGRCPGRPGTAGALRFRIRRAAPTVKDDSHVGRRCGPVGGRAQSGQEGSQLRARRRDPQATHGRRIILEDTKDGVRWKRK